MGFIGQNGAGKSTTIRCILGVDDFSSGEIKLFGQDIVKKPLEIRQKVGYVSEEHYFYDEMSAFWTGKFISGFYKDWDFNLFNELLRRFGIDGRKKVKELSKGMKMKLSLALALSHQPELLILDEPTSGLDPVARDNLLDLFLDLMQDENRSIFFSSHITSDMEKIADYITVIDDGKILMCDDKDRLLSQWVMVKADGRYLTPDLSSLLSGIKEGPHGISGITNNIQLFNKRFHDTFPQGNFLTDRISLDELLVRLVKKNDSLAS